MLHEWRSSSRTATAYVASRDASIVTIELAVRVERASTGLFSYSRRSNELALDGTPGLYAYKTPGGTAAAYVACRNASIVTIECAMR